MSKCMKTILLPFFLLLAAFSANAQQNYTVAVTPFDIVGSDISQNDADVILDLFMTELSNVRGLRVVDRNSFNQIMAQMRFQTTDWSDPNKVAQFGRALNANSIIRGQLATLGGRIIISSRIVDVNTTEILSGAPLQLNSLSELVGRLSAYTESVVRSLPKRNYNIGDIGPGGGIVFSVRDGKYIECSGEFGTYKWRRATEVAQNYQGGGYTDWRLPTKEELDLMYVNLKLRNLGNFANEWYWSSSEYIDQRVGFSVVMLNFSDGMRRDNGDPGFTYVRMRAVRSF